MATRGSSKLLQEQGISEGELERLWELIDGDEIMDLVHWETKGTPRIDQIVGAVKVDRKKLGPAIGGLAQLDGLPLRFDVFPLGIPVPREMLVRFARGDARI